MHKTFNPGVDYKGETFPFVIAYIDNNNLSTQNQIFATNDFNFHNSLTKWAHNGLTLYSGDIANAIKEAEQENMSKILWAKKGLTHLNDFIQLIMDEQLYDCDSWEHDLLGWINLETQNTKDIPDQIVNYLRKTSQLKDYDIGTNYYNLLTNHKRWYVINTEDKELIYHPKHQTEIQVTAGALTPAIEAYKYVHEPGKIIIVDNCTVAHHVFDYLLENWNGRHYADIVRKIVKNYPSIAVDFQNYDDSKLQEYSDFLDTPRFAEKWEIVKKSTILHKPFDILGWDASELIDGCNSYETVVNYSNAYMFYPTAIYYSQEQRYAQWNKVNSKINEKNDSKVSFNIKFKQRGYDGILRYVGRRP